jgi:L-fuculose-phosphate aldolase
MTPVDPRLVDVCHRLYARGLVTATDGNVSVRLEHGNILTTRSGINKGLVTEQDFIEVSPDGKRVAGDGKPSTELGMHLYIYGKRSDIHAVVHAHPPYATGFATARIPLDTCTFPEVIVGFGSIPLAAYATPSTGEVAESLAPYVSNTDAILLANHGAVTCGSDIFDAYFKMEKLEHAAHITFVAGMLGGAATLSREQLEKLRRVSGTAYGKEFSFRPACETADNDTPSEEEVKEHVIRKLHGFGLI